MVQNIYTPEQIAPMFWEAAHRMIVYMLLPISKEILDKNGHTRKVPWHLSQRWSRFYT